jgi:hypothetical protein
MAGQPRTRRHRQRRLSVPDYIALTLMLLGLAGIYLFATQGRSGEPWVAASVGVAYLGAAISIFWPGQPRRSHDKGTVSRARIIGLNVPGALGAGLYLTIIHAWSWGPGSWVSVIGGVVSFRLLLSYTSRWLRHRRERSKVQ